jgi:hypothetical protein
LQDGRLSFGSKSADGNAALGFGANRFDDSHLAIGDQPIDLRQVPVLNLPVPLGLHAGGRILRATLGFAQCLGLVFLQGEGPSQTETFHFLDEGRWQIQNVTHEHIQETPAQLSDQILQ